MSDEVILRNDLGGGVVELVLNRPEKLNAIDVAMRTRLLQLLDEACADHAARVLIIRGAGRAFSAGADATGGGEQMPRDAEGDREHILETSWPTYLRFWDAPKPVIAQVHGYCLANATILCNCCDIVVAAEDAVIGWPNLPLGGGAIGPSWVWHVGVHRAKELSYQVGSRVSGAEAAAMGWANYAVPAEELEANVRALAARIARVPADILRIKKEAINRVYDGLGFREAMRLGATWAALSHHTAGAEDVRGRIREVGLTQAIEEYRRSE